MEEIIKKFIELREKFNLNFDDKTLFEQAVDLYISMGIQKGYKDTQESKKPYQNPLKQEFKGSDKPSEKQLYYLKKNKIDFPKEITKKEATQLIKEYKESLY